MSKIIFFTGAGLSAESGISTFRDNVDGLWTQYDPAIVATLSSMREHREVIFKFYNERRVAMPTLKPNAAHFGIAEVQKKYGKENVTIYTQNIDNFLEMAGCEDVVHVHGKFTEMMCRLCDTTWDIGYTEFAHDAPCPHCGTVEWVKPGVIFFGEGAPEYEDMYKTFKKARNNIIVVIGTSGEVVPMERVVGNRFSTNRPYTILNNKDRDKYGMINYKQDFDHTIFKPATEGIVRIKELIEERYPLLE